jgi:molybdopterin synthase catalytic subunit
MDVRVQTADLDLTHETDTLLARCPDAGAVASFLGVVRSTRQRPIEALFLEHYPAMTRPALAEIAAEARTRFDLLGGTLIHRHGHLRPGEKIVLVLTAARHRTTALDATAFLIDWLKTKAPFWKKEFLPDGTTAWVDARPQDDEAAARWSSPYQAAKPPA